MPAICRAVGACGFVVGRSVLLPSFCRLAALCAGVFDQREVSMTTIRWVAAVTVALACGAGAGSAWARDVHWSIGVAVPGVGLGAGLCGSVGVHGATGVSGPSAAGVLRATPAHLLQRPAGVLRAPCGGVRRPWPGHLSPWFPPVSLIGAEGRWLQW